MQSPNGAGAQHQIGLAGARVNMPNALVLFTPAPASLGTCLSSTRSSSSFLCKAAYRPRPAQRSTAAPRRIAAPCMDAAGAGVYAERTKPSDVHVVVFGATGYIGRVVVSEFSRQGYDVTAFTRPRSGIGGRQDAAAVQADLSPARVVLGDVCDPASIKPAFGRSGAEYASTVAVSCLASRSGGVADSARIDYAATLNALEAARAAGVQHFVLLSAVCVQRPTLAFQREKLRFEAALQEAAAEDPAFSYAIVRPTAFFKSLAAQVDSVKKGHPYIMFGDGDLAKCNALSERDLARFIVECARDEGKRNRILPVGGPGEPVTPKQQAEMLFRIVGREPKYWSLPLGIMDGVIGVLDALAKVLPFFVDPAEFGRIGKYYASEDMIGPSYGTDTLEEFFQNAVKEGGMANQDLGEAKYF